MIEKIELRKIAKQIRLNLDLPNISKQIAENILTLNEFETAKNVMFFYPMHNEIDILGVVSDKKNFYLPKVDGLELLVCPYRIGDNLSVSKYKTMEPLTKPVSVEILDVVIVPALMVDKTFNRLGYGGGFYDRFLSKLPQSVLKIVVIPEKLLIDKIPLDIFDEKVDVTICENNIFKVAKK